MKRFTGNALAGAALCLPMAAGLFAAYLLPLAMALRQSFFAQRTGAFCGVENYRALLCDPVFCRAAANTLLFLALALPLGLAAGLALALLCSRCAARWEGAALFVPSLFPAACVAALTAAALPQGAVLAGAKGGAVLLAVYLLKNCGCPALILTAGLAAIPRELLQAAAAEGAGRWQTLWRVRLPLLRGAVGAALLAELLAGARFFREAYLLAGAHPDPALYTLPHFLFNNFLNGDSARLAAASVLFAAGMGAVCAGALAALKKRGGGL